MSDTIPSISRERLPRDDEKVKGILNSGCPSKVRLDPLIRFRTELIGESTI